MAHLERKKKEERRKKKEFLSSIFSLLSFHLTPMTQSAEVPNLKFGCCGFDSH
jgi:hypothetical protein